MPSKKIILLVDDEELVKDTLDIILDSKYDILYCPTVACAKKELASGRRLGLIVLDLMMYEESGFALLDYIRTNGIEVKVIVYSSSDHVQAVREAFKRGASDYISKQNTDREEIASIIEKAIQ
jgi:DNA-binding NtrC family response regulator